MDKFVLPKFCDMHVHVRQGDDMRVITNSLDYSYRLLCMPNTCPPILTGHAAMGYFDRMVQVDSRAHRRALTTIKLLDGTSPATISEAKACGVVAAKLYPANATTNAEDGVTDLNSLYPAFKEMADCNMVLCLHGEIVGRQGEQHGAGLGGGLPFHVV